MPTNSTGGRDSRANRKLNASAASRGGRVVICWICGEPIDMTLDRKRDPMAYTADHVQSLQSGGDLLGERLPAHRRCNSQRGAQERHRLAGTSRDTTRAKKHPTSRDW